MPKKKIDQVTSGAIMIYKGKGNTAELKVRLEAETVWLTQAQIAALFFTDRSSITKHIKNIITSSELSEKSNVQFLHIAGSDKPVKFYNLNFILSIGYRVNSKQATQFRIWATKILRDYILQGYALNQKRLQETGMHDFEQAVALVRRLVETKKLKSDEARGLLDVITGYAQSWLLLQKYDKGQLDVVKTTPGRYVLDYDTAVSAIHELKKDLLGKKLASELFGSERDEMLSGILAGLNQTFGGKELYPSIEAKAAHLLYFIIKDHPFSDGNKRIASFLFIVFLTRNDFLYTKKGERKINATALVAIALLIAESDPQQKEVMIKLVMNFLQA